jgi:hypothetical protein
MIMNYKPTLFTPLELIDKIHEVTLPLQKTLKTLADNSNAKPDLKQTALRNYECVKNLHTTAEEIANCYQAWLANSKIRMKL